MLIRILIISLLLLTFSAETSSEESKVVDSLKNALATEKDNQKRFDLLLNLSHHLMGSDSDGSLGYGEEALAAAKNTGKSKNVIIAYIQLAKICFYFSDLNKAMEYATKAKDMAENENLDYELALSLDAIGVIYYDIGYKAKSSENFFRTLKIYEKLGDKEGIGANYCRIGTLYHDQRDLDKAVEYFIKSIELAREINSNEGIASNLNNLAKVYYEKKEYDSALITYEEAVRINLEEGNTYLVASNYLNMAPVYLELKQYDQAIKKLSMANEIFNKLGNKLRLAKSQVMQSEVYFKSGQKAQAEMLAINTLMIGKENGFKEIIMSASALLSKMYIATNDSARALKYYMLERQYQDSIFIEEKEKSLANLELQYEFEKMEKDFSQARQRRNTAIVIISVILAMSFVIIFLILKQLKLRAKKMQLEREGYEREITFKNKEMVLNVMSLMKKNEMLTGLSEKLIAIEKESGSAESKETIKKVAAEIQKSQEKEIWKEFSLRFKEVQGDFYEKLLQKFPSLTPNELKLCAFLRLNMSSKDIAELTGQRVSSLETARYRLRQKLGIANSDINLVTFLSSI